MVIEEKLLVLSWKNAKFSVKHSIYFIQRYRLHISDELFNFYQALYKID